MKTEGKIKNIKNIPKLRFKEFSDEWESFSIDNLLENRGGTALEDQVKKNGTHKFISIGNYSINGKYIDNGQRVFLDAKTKQKLLDKNDLVMVLNDKTTSGDLIGSTILIDDDNCFVYNQRSERLICNTSKLTPKYAWLILNSPKFRKRIYSISQGGTQIYVNFPSVKKLILDLPATKEQQKIASFLTAVDEKVAKLEEKKNLFEKYKKGVMQGIFSQKIRFKKPDGSSYPEWEERKLGEVYEFIRTNSLSREALANTGSILNIHYGDIHTKLPTQLDLTQNRLSYIKDIALQFTEKEFCQIGDVAIADASEDYADIGKCVEIKNVGKQQAVSGLHTFLLRPISCLSVGFGGYMMRSENILRQIRKIATGVSVLGISKSNFAKIVLFIPSEKEQGKIAEFLTTLDDKIDLLIKELEKEKEFKKGLLQGMFV